MKISATKVVVPYDFSNESERVMNAALKMADCPSHLHVVHVAPNITTMEPGVVWDTVTNESRQASLIQSFQEKHPSNSESEIQFHVFFGDAGYEIAQFAEDIAADLIVLSSHGHNIITRLLIGSVAERVVRLAHCPVLVLKKQE